MPLELSEMTPEEVLRSHSSVKGHRTRYEKEIANLLQLCNTQHSLTSEDRINDRLERVEKHTHKLSDITDYLGLQPAQFFYLLSEPLLALFQVI